MDKLAPGNMNLNMLRSPISALLAVAMTFALFLFMFNLISPGNTGNTDLAAIRGIHFGAVEIPDELTLKNRRIPNKPPPPREPPRPPELQVSRMDQTVQNIAMPELPDLDVPMAAGEGMYIGNFASVDKTEEGDIIPIVVIRPMYPRDAAMRGQEGWVKIEFTITAIGTVKNPNVIDAYPPRVFNREAIRAILKWKFKPKVINGVAVDRPATQLINFSLDQSGS